MPVVHLYLMSAVQKTESSWNRCKIDTVVIECAPWNVLLASTILPKRIQRKCCVWQASQEYACKNLDFEWECIWKNILFLSLFIIRNQTEPYSYSKSFYWRKLLAGNEKSTNEQSVEYGNYDDEWFAEQYITEIFTLYEHYNVTVSCSNPWNTILVRETTAALLFSL